MQSYYHYLVLFDEITPTLENLTDLVRGELDEGNFGPASKVRVVWWKTVPYRGKETALKVRVTGPDRDIKLIRANLRAEYGKLGPPAEDFPEDLQIRNATHAIYSHRQFGIKHQTSASIQRALGSQVRDQGSDGDKVLHCWDFTAKGVNCSIWDYKGSSSFKHWSFYGPREVAVELFGEANVTKGVGYDE